MTRDEITSIAREAGFVGMDAQHGALRRFAALVAEAEREACAKIAARAAPQPPKLSDERLFHYAAEIRKALEPDPVGATLNIVALLRAIEREILGVGNNGIHIHSRQCCSSA